MTNADHTTRRRIRGTHLKLFAAIAALVMVGALAPVFAQGPGGGGNNSNAQPADKIAVAGASYAIMRSDTSAPSTVSLFDPAPTIKTSKPTDLIIQVNLECSVLTQTFVSNNPVFGPQISRAEGRIIVWVEINGVVVKVDKNDVVDADGNRPGEVVFCDRAQEKEFREVDEENRFNATIRDFQRTRGAHSFTWIALDVGFNHPSSNVHTVAVLARLEASIHNDPANAPAQAFAEAVIGKRTLVVDPVKLANNAQI